MRSSGRCAVLVLSQDVAGLAQSDPLCAPRAYPSDAFATSAQPPPRVDAAGMADVSVKTRTQLLAERNVLRSLLATAIAGAGDPALRPAATDFASGICRHFALLFAGGASSPLSAPLLKGQPLGLASPKSPDSRPRTASLQELDPHIFLDALVDVRAPFSAAALSLQRAPRLDTLA